jgi:hypothetical protein
VHAPVYRKFSCRPGCGGTGLAFQLFKSLGRIRKAMSQDNGKQMRMMDQETSEVMRKLRKDVVNSIMATSLRPNVAKWVRVKEIAYGVEK